MRLNKFLATNTPLSRRGADEAIAKGQVSVNGYLAGLGTQLYEGSKVVYAGKTYVFSETAAKVAKPTILLLNKPIGYVCSRDGQGSKTIYDLLPANLGKLKPAGRLDKDSSGLLVMTDDGDLLNELTHPRFKKQKVYEVTIDKSLRPADVEAITKTGVRIGDPRPSQFSLQAITTVDRKLWRATLEEGRNRQIRRTFEAVGYEVKKLHRIQFGPYKLDNKLKSGAYTIS